MPKIGHISILVFAILHKSPSLKSLRLLHLSIFSHEIFRINAELNFALKLLFRFLKKKSKKNWRPNSEISPGKFRMWQPIFLKLFFQKSEKFSSTLILKISWENIKKCKSLRLLTFWATEIYAKTQIEIGPILRNFIGFLDIKSTF